ncbi:Ubiquitin--protein ligase [Bertholletia excelsa]
MGGNGWWKFSRNKKTSSSGKFDMKEPPAEFLCPISGSLMFDPVVVASGQTFERTSVQVCMDLGFAPLLPDGSRPDFSTLISNLALKSTILKWCDTPGIERPKAPDYSSVEKAVRALMARGEDHESKTRVSVRELLEGGSDTPPVLFTHEMTELKHRANRFYSSSSEESVIVNAVASPLLEFNTLPMSYSSSSSTSSEIGNDGTLNPNSNSEEEELVAKLRSQDVYEQEQGLITLRKITRTKEEARVPLCTPRLLCAVKPLLISRYAAVQTHAVAALVNLSLENANKVKIVRSGIVPPLIQALRSGTSEAQEHAAGGLFSLALDDENKTAIGVLGALPPLLHALRASGSERCRRDAALALYHLSLAPSNQAKLVKLGAALTLLTMARSGGSLVATVVTVIRNIAASAEGRAAMLDANAVEVLVWMLREGSELSQSTREGCVAALYSLSQGSMRFKGLAMEARAAEVLRTVAERGRGRTQEKARKMLLMMGGRDEEEEATEKDDVGGRKK